MYKLLKEPEFDETAKVLCSMEDEYGGRARIVNDDHCFVLQLWVDDPQSSPDEGQGHQWHSVSHWFKEAADALHDMVFLYKTIDDVPGATEENEVS